MKKVITTKTLWNRSTIQGELWFDNIHYSGLQNKIQYFHHSVQKKYVSAFKIALSQSLIIYG